MSKKTKLIQATTIFLRDKKNSDLNFSEIERVARIPQSMLSHVRAGRRELTYAHAWNFTVWVGNHYNQIHKFIAEIKDFVG